MALRINWNDYNENPKEFCIYTPLDVSFFLHDIMSINNYSIVLDLCCGTGNLSVPFQKTLSKVIGIDIENTGFSLGEFLKYDFIKSKAYDKYLKEQKIELVLCNPPWNRCESKKLFPFEFLKRVFEIFGCKIPFVLFTPMGFRLNRRYGAKREKKMEEYFENGTEITSIVSMPIDTFYPGDKNKGQQWEIIIFNVPSIKSHYWYTEKLRQKYIKLAKSIILEKDWGKKFPSHSPEENLCDISQAVTQTHIKSNTGKIVIYEQDSFLPK